MVAAVTNGPAAGVATTSDCADLPIPEDEHLGEGEGEEKPGTKTGFTISTLLHDRINPKDCQVLSLGDTGFLQFFRVVSRDYGKPWLR